jgi:hypothetical protein
MKSLKEKTLLPLVAISAALLAGCGQESETITEEAEAMAASHSDWLSESRPESSMTLAMAIQEQKEDVTITVEGRIGGMREPITRGLGAFVLADEAIWFCDEGEEDHCPTPWDACCEDPDKVRALTALVEFKDGEGYPLMIDLEKQLGLQANQTVAVTGVLSTDPNGNRTITAQSIWIAP